MSDKIRMESLEEYYKRKNVEREKNGCLLSEEEADALLMALSDGAYDRYAYERPTGGNEEDNNTPEEDDDVMMSAKKDNGDVLFEMRRMPRLEVISDRFARLATNKLSNLFGLRVELNPISIDATYFGEFMRSLPVPTGINICSANVFGTQFLTVFDTRCVFTMVEAAFGTSPHQPCIEGREFTRIEQAVIDKAEDAVLDALEEAWGTCILNTRMKQERSEINPQFAGIVNPKDPCIATYFEVEFDTCLASLMVIIPYKALDPYVEVLKGYNHSLKILTNDDYIKYTSRNPSDSEPNMFFSLAGKTRVIPAFFNSDKKYLAFLNAVPARTLSMIMRNEHPQTLACVAAYMSPSRSAEFITTLPAGIRAQIVFRMDKLEIRNQIFLGVLENVLLNSLHNVPPMFMEVRRGRAVMEAMQHISKETYDEIREEILEESESFFD